MRQVYFLINGVHHTITGNWRWDLPVEELFCTSMFVSLPSEEAYAGVLLAIIDPDYVHDLTNIFSQSSSGKVLKLLRIRIITSEGKAVIITLDFIETIVQHSLFEGFENKIKELAYHHMLLIKENQFFEKNIFGYKTAETIAAFGIWYMNQETQETYYSDNVFRIYGLKPQSVTARLTSFEEYIHPEDQRIVRDTFRQAFSSRLPLHLEFRILRQDGVQCWVAQYTRWNFDANGAHIMTGIIQDITDRKTETRNREYTEESSHFNQKLLRMSEELAQLGHWRINLITRQSFFSNQFYQVFGSKNKTSEPGLEDLIPLVHQEDQERFQASINRLFLNFQPINMEVRIISADGKLRYVLWKSEIVTLSDDPVVSGLLQDNTVFKFLHAKWQKYKTAFKRQLFLSGTSDKISGIGSWIWDTETGTVFCSENLYMLLGYKFPDSLPQEKLLEAVYLEDKKKFHQHLMDLAIDGQESEFEFRVMQKGVIKRLKAIFKCMPMEKKRIVLGMFRDISNEVKLRKDLTANVSYSDSLGDSINYRVFILDTQYRVSGWNNKSEKAYGLKKAEILGKNLFEALPALKTPLVTESLRKAMRGEEVILPRVKGLLSEGFLEVSIAPQYDEQNKITGVLCLLRDISATIRLQDELNQRLSFIERLLESTVDRIAVLDRQMNFLYWNKKAEEHYLLSKTWVLGKNILEISSAINMPSVNEFKKALKGEKVYIPTIKQERSAAYEETYIIPILDDQSEVTSILWIVHDLARIYELKD